MGKIAIAIDGPAGSGKSTTAREVARRLNYVYVDTGAMYRAIALKTVEKKVNVADVDAVVELARNTAVRLLPHPDRTHIEVDGADRSSDIRTPEVTARVSAVATLPGVRTILVEKQRAMADEGGIVMDGRDIGTVVLPQAQLKVFMVADNRERARRRVLEYKQQGKDVPLDEVLAEITARDKADSERETSPLKKADDAVELDTTGLTLDAQFDLVEKLAREKISSMDDATKTAKTPKTPREGREERDQASKRKKTE